MFFTRRDGKTVRSAMRRVKSPRASVYLEFAVVMPLVAMIIAFIFEFISLWDARIMANHTAWVCGRIASANVGVKAGYDDGGKKNRLLNDDMRTSALFLMSTCGVGGALDGTSSGTFESSKIKTVVSEPCTELEGCYGGSMTTIADEIAKTKIPAPLYTRSLIGILTSGIVSAFNNTLKGIADPVSAAIKGMDSSWVFSDVNATGLAGALSDSTRIKQFGAAQSRLSKFGDRIFDITERKDARGQMFFRSKDINTENEVDFPRQVASIKEKDVKNKWMVNKDCAWPPKDQSQCMIDVKLYWPMERAWMWKALMPVKKADAATSTDGDALAGGDAIAAVGRAIVYPQPVISNANLSSVNPDGFADGDETAMEIVADQMEGYNDFLKVVWFYYTYRLRNESVGELFVDRYARPKAFMKPDYLFISWPCNSCPCDELYQTVKWNWGLSPSNKKGALYNWMTGLVTAEDAQVLNAGNEGNEKKRRTDIHNRWKNDKTYRTKSYVESHNKFYASCTKRVFNTQQGKWDGNSKDTVGEKLATQEHKFSESEFQFRYNPDRYRFMDWFCWHSEQTNSQERLRFAHYPAQALVDFFFLKDCTAYYNVYPCNCYALVPDFKKEWSSSASPIQGVSFTAQGYYPIPLDGYKGSLGANVSAYCFMANSSQKYIDSGDRLYNEVLEQTRSVAASLGMSKGAVDEFVKDVTNKRCHESVLNNCRPGADHLITSTFQLSDNLISPDDLISQESRAFEGFLHGLPAQEKNLKDLIVKCGEEMATSLGLVGSGSHDELDADVSIGDPLIDSRLTPEVMQDPEQLKKLVKQILEEQKQKVFKLIQEVDEAEQALIDLKAEEKFRQIRDARMKAIYSWLAEETVCLYGTHYGQQFAGCCLPRRVSSDNRFLPQLNAFQDLHVDWSNRLMDVWAADVRLGQALGLQTTSNLTTNEMCSVVDGFDNLGPIDPDDPGGATATSGSKDDKRGEEWFYDNSSRRWKVDDSKMYWEQNKNAL